MVDVAVSAGSACSSGSIQPSHVLTALGHTHAEALSTLRFSLGRFTTDAEVDEVVRYVSVAVAKLRG
jgi:cysteine desulfurase